MVSNKNKLRPKVGNLTPKSEVGVSREAPVVLQSRKSHCFPCSQSKVVFSRVASNKTSSDQNSEILPQSRKWVFRDRLLSFCKVEHTIAFQKVVFPYVWALHASPSNHPPASFLFILLCPATQDLSCQHSVDMKPTLLRTSEYMNRVAFNGVAKSVSNLFGSTVHVYIYIYI